MQPATRSQEPRGFGRRGVRRWKVPSAIIQAVPTQAQNTKSVRYYTHCCRSLSVSPLLYLLVLISGSVNHTPNTKVLSTCLPALWPVHQGPVAHKVGYCQPQPKQKWAKFMCQHSDTKGSKKRQKFLKRYSFPHINAVKHWFNHLIFLIIRY